MRKFIAALILFLFIPIAANATLYSDAAEMLGLGTGEFRRLLYLIAPPFLILIIPFIIWVINLFRTRKKGLSPHEKYRLIGFGGTWLYTIISPFPWMFAMIINAILKHKWQKQQNEIDRARLVNADGLPYRLLSEKEEDEAMLRGLLEVEIVKSDRYDVWVDFDTDELIVEKTLNWHPWRIKGVGKFKGFTVCPQCSKKTLSPWNRKSYVASSRWMISPLRRRHVRWTKNCTSCSHAEYKGFWYYVIRWPIEGSGTYSNSERSNSRSISSYMGKNIFSGSSSSSSSSSSSNSSSSGSSYGGGSSGGGGSTGGW